MSTLLISPSFFGYYKKIIEEVELRGEKIFWINDWPSTNFWIKALIRFLPFFMKAYCNSYFREKFESLKGESFTRIVVIKGESLSEDSIRLLRSLCPTAQFIIYFWDSYLNMDPRASQKVSLFDKAFSFDLDDTLNDSRLVYRPLFFLNNYRLIANEKPAVASALFVGTMHSDRYKVLKLISANFPENFGFTRLMFFPSVWAYWFKKIFDSSYVDSSHKIFRFDPLSADEVIQYVQKSSIVIDIERAVQNGFTMRTLEMLAAERKLISTNPNLKTADFYNPNNILIVDRNSPTIAGDFLTKPWEPISNDIVNNYSIAKWVDDIIFN
jgi:hypothetical protein